MNRAARRSLLGLLERATTPLYVFTIQTQDAASKIREARDAIASLCRWTTVLVPSYDLKIIAPKPSGVRVVAGKGSRRRGIRRDDPLRIVRVRLPEYPKRIDLVPESFSVSNG